MQARQIRIQSLQDTDTLAGRLAGQIEQAQSLPMFLALCGPLGAGKTQFVRSLAAHLGVAADEVTSPTYILMQRYRGRLPIVHLDFYRLRSIEEAWDLGLDEWLEEPAIVVVEWADMFPETWPMEWLKLEITLLDDASRLVSLSSQGSRASQLLP